MDAEKTGGQPDGIPSSVPLATTSPEWQTRLQATLEALPDLLFVMDRDSCILDFHAPNRIGLFLTPERFLGAKAVDVLPEPAATVVRQAIAEALATGHHQGGTYSLAMPSGERWFELSIAAHGDPNSDGARLVAIARDVTERKQAEDALRESERTYRMLTEGMQDVIWVLDVEARRFTYVSPSVEKLRGYTPAEILAQPLEAAWVPEQRAELEEFTRRSVAAFLAGQMTSDDYATYEMLQPCKDGSRVASEVVARLVRNPQTGRLEAHGVTRDVSARKRTEQALRESETRFAELARQTRTIVFEMDADGRCTFVSPMVADLLGYRPEEVIGKLHFYDLFAPADREAFKAAAFDVFRKKAPLIDFENPCVTRDGRPIWVSTNAFPLLHPDGTLRGYRGSVVDVTARKQAELALRRSEARFAETARQSRAFVWEVDADGLYMFVTPVVEDVLGYRPDEIAGRLHFYDLHPAEGREAFRTAAFAAMGRHEKFLDFENPVVAKDGRTTWVSTNAIPLLDPTGALLGYRGVDIDVTARKLAEDALRESETRLRTLNDNLPGGLVYQMDTGVDGRERRLLAVSKGVEQMHGVTVEEALSQQKTFYLQIVPEDQARIAELETRAIATLTPFRAEVRCRMPTGEIRWIYVSSAPRRLPNGHLVWDGIEIDVTDRKQAEEALRESEAARRNINDHVPDGMVFQMDTGPDGQTRGYSYVSDGALALHGFTPEALMADASLMYRQLLPEDAGRVAALEKQAFDTMTPFRVEARFRLPSGEIRWRSIMSAPRRLPNDHLVWDGIEIDVTDRKQAEEALRESEARTRAVQDNLPDGLVYQIDSGPDGQERRFTFLSQGVERLHGISAAEALRDPMAVYGQVLPEDLRDVAAREAQAAKALTPLRIEVRVRLPSGEIRWRRFTSAPRRLPDGHLVWDGIEIDVTERKQAEEALRESEARFAASTQAGRSYVWQVDPEGLFTYASPMVQEILGRRPEELVGQLHFYDLLPEEDREEVKNFGLALMARRETINGFENRNATQDGRLVWVSSSASPLFGPDGTFRGYQGIDTDITQRKQAEEALQQSEAKYRQLHESMRDAFATADMRGRIQDFNAAFRKLTGYSAAELRKISYRRLTPRKWHAAEAKILKEQVLTRGYSDVYEKEYLRKDGSVVPVELRTVLIRDAAGQATGMWASIRDVTERKRAEEALRESESKYRRLYAGMRDAFVIADMQGRLVDCNPAFEALIGYRREEITRLHYADLTPARWGPTDARAVKRILRRGYSDVTAKEYVRKDGTLVPVEITGTLIRDASGKPAGIAAFIRDVTERKRAEEALRESESKYRLLFENMRDAFAAMDLKGRLIDCNPAFEKLVGYSRDEVRRLHLADITPREWIAVEKKALAQMRRRGYSKRFEKEYVRKDGTRVPVELQGSLIRDARGRAAGAWAIIRDVSERKLAENELRQAHDELERRVQERTAELVASQQELAASEEQFRQMAESIQEVFWLLDVRTGQALYVSPAFEAIWGQPRQTLHNGLSQWLATLHPDDRDVVQRDFERGVRTGTFTPLKYRILWPDGTVRWIRDSAWGIRDRRGRVVRVAGVFRDITDQRRLEAELLTAAENERQRIGRDLHDSLGQSLTAIGYLADAVREDLARAKRSEADDVRKLGRLIGQTAAEAHALARGLLLADLKRGGLAAALQELAFRTQELFGNACRYSGPGTLPPLDVQTAGQLYRIAQEAVTNAGKHGKAKRIEIRLAKDRRGLLLSVRDTGKGIAAKKKTGSGLGLDIMRYRAGLIGATLWIDSQPRRGTTVNCLLPRAASAPKRKK